MSGIAVLRLGSSFGIGADHLNRYSYVLLGMSARAPVARIKHLSRATKVLGYKSSVELQDDCRSGSLWCNGGIAFQEAQAHDARHPNDRWILRTASGQSLQSPHYPHAHLANVGSASYQQEWARRVSAAAAAGRFDGVMIDGVLGLVSGWTGGRYPTAYPSDSAWGVAMTRFMRFVGPALKARGLYVLANAFKGGSNDESNDALWWRTIAPYVNGLMAEFWEQSPVTLALYDTNPCCWTGHWEGWLRLASVAQRAGVDFFPLQYSSSADVRTMTYGKASFLLVWDGSGGGYIFNPRNSADPWNRAWTTSIGTPLGPRRTVGVGWRRNYTRGTALVNPDPTSVQTFSLGQTYSTLDGTRVKSVTLQPVSGMILRRPAGSRTPPRRRTRPIGRFSAVVAMNGKCLDAATGKRSGAVRQWTCLGRANQRWKLAARGGYYAIVGKSSRKCLEIEGGSTSNGARVRLERCGAVTSQRWKLFAVGGGYHEIVSKGAGKCLDVENQSSHNGALVQQWSCWKGENQKWKLVPPR